MDLKLLADINEERTVMKIFTENEDYNKTFPRLKTKINWVSPRYFRDLGRKAPGFIIYKGEEYERKD
jgi:hypothetical protein